MKKLALIAALIGCFGIAHAGDLIANGSFEDQTQATGNWNVFKPRPAWKTDSGSGIESRNTLAGSAHASASFVELDSYATRSTSQSVATTLGAGYTLSFAYSPREGPRASGNPIEVLGDGHSLATISADGAVGQDWQIPFRAVGRNDSNGGSLDAVALAKTVPEPASYFLALSGLALFFGMRLRRSDR